MANEIADPRIPVSRRNIAEMDSQRALAELSLQGPRLQEMLMAHFRVIGAVLLRDIRTRVAGTRFGFLISLGMPLSHIGVLLIIYYMVGRTAPIGTNTTIFLATGTLAFVTFSYAFRQVKMAPQQNRQLTHFPGVTLVDLLIARSLVELISTALVAVFTLLALRLVGLEVSIFNKPLFAYALLQCYLIGIAFGVLFGLLGRVWPAVLVLGNVMLPLFWVTSGVLFIPSMLPEEVVKWVWYFPLSQLVDLTRVAYYGHYISDYYNGSYITGVMMTLLGASAAVLRLLRTALSEA